MTLDQLSDVIPWVALVQLAVIVVLFFLFFLLRVILKMKDRRINQKIEKITLLLNELITHQNELSPQVIQFFKKNLRELLHCMSKIEDTSSSLPDWVKIKKILSNQLLKPKARQLAFSSRWLKQYFAILCFDYGVTHEDDSALSKLVQSNQFIVSLNAARIILKYPSPLTINALIDSLSQGRRIQQSLYAEIFAAEHLDDTDVLRTILSNRLINEQDPYIKTFCYRILMRFEPTNHLLKITNTDISSNNLELKIAALSYLSRFQHVASRDMLRKYLDDPEPSVRAVVAKLMGEIHDEKSIPSLEEKLHDFAWWVRINAAQALSQLGEKGILILRQQSPKLDRFAYETAQKILITLESKQ